MYKLCYIYVALKELLKKVLVALKRAVWCLEEFQILSLQNNLGVAFVNFKGDPGGVKLREVPGGV